MAVYFLMDEEAGAVKIGWAVNVVTRIGFLQAGNPRKLKLLRTVEGRTEEERWLHHHFAALRIRAEWFRFDAEMLSVVPGKLRPTAKHDFAPVPIGSPILRDALARIEAFVRKAGLSEHRFGILATGDPKFLKRFRAMRTTLYTLERAEAFIETAA